MVTSMALYELSYCAPKYPLYAGNMQTGTLTKSEDQYEMLLDASFHQCKHCLVNKINLRDRNQDFTGS